MKHVDPREFAPKPSINKLLSPEEYIRLLHPKGSFGNPAVLARPTGGESRSWTFRQEVLLTHLPSYLETTSFVSLNRFRGKRQNKNLAALNALFVDLDYCNSINWRGKSPDIVQAAYAAHLTSHGLPQPSIYTRTGRGAAAIWLHGELPPEALRRWKSTLKALIDLSREFGADPSCNDESRVFRLPGTVNEKSGRLVQVSGGTFSRYDFDALSDQIYVACGRPTRAALEARRKAKKQTRKPGQIMPRGLTQEQRFRLILEDLEIFRHAHGGAIPVGLRNTWLHFYATCLTHLSDVVDIETRIMNIAAVATAGLKPGDVQATIRQAEDKAKSHQSNCVWRDGRYSYRGETIAFRLGISPLQARSWGLQQVIPGEERMRRKAASERQRRAARGASTREEYLKANPASRDRPWERYGLGRSQYYARKKAGNLPELEAA
jgi:hypothetical protein